MDEFDRQYAERENLPYPDEPEQEEEEEERTEKISQTEPHPLKEKISVKKQSSKEEKKISQLQKKVERADIPDQKCKNENLYVQYISKIDNKTKCLKIWNDQEQNDIYVKHDKIIKYANDLEELHDLLIQEGKKLGDPNHELDDVEEKLDAIIQVYVQLQIKIDEDCVKGKSENKCPSSHCVWIARELKWYEKFYKKQEGICLSQKQAILFDHQYKEYTEQLSSISERLNEFEKKSTLTRSEKESKLYLTHLRNKLIEIIEADRSVYQNLSLLLALQDAYTQLLNYCAKAAKNCSNDITIRYQELLRESQKKATDLRNSQTSWKWKWGILSPIRFALVAIYSHYYTLKLQPQINNIVYQKKQRSNTTSIFFKRSGHSNFKSSVSGIFF